MTLKAITVIVLRLFAIMYLVQAIVNVAGYIPSFVSAPFDFGSFIFEIVYPAMLFLLGVALWLLAARVAELATKGVDGPLALGALTKADIYSFAFVFIGLDYLVGSIGAALEELYSYVNFAMQSGYSSDSTKIPASLATHGLTVVAGIVAIFGARFFTRKMLRYEQKDERAENEK